MILCMRRERTSLEDTQSQGHGRSLKTGGGGAEAYNGQAWRVQRGQIVETQQNKGRDIGGDCTTVCDMWGSEKAPCLPPTTLDDTRSKPNRRELLNRLLCQL